MDTFWTVKFGDKSLMIGSLLLCCFVPVTFAQDAMFVDSSGNVGVGTNTPNAPLHVQRSAGAQVFVENTSGTVAERVPFKLANNGKTRFEIVNGTDSWTFDNSGSQFNISFVGTGVNEFIVENDGDGRFRGRSFATDHVNTSSREAKTDFSAVDEGSILEKVEALDISRWRYKKDPNSQQHIGPVAEDFQELFGIGDGSHISTVDSAGVSLAAIKGLSHSLEELRDEAKAKSARIQALEARNEELRDRLRSLEARVSGMAQ